MKITRGIVKRAQKIVVYGPEGVGKTTFASQFPEPLFMDTEDGSTHLDVARLDKPTSMPMVGQQLDFIKNNKPCKTLVIDTVDWLELLVTEYVITKDGKTTIGAVGGGYGQGYVQVKEAMGRVLNQLNEVIDAGIHVVLLAHSIIKTFEDPLHIGSYDRYILKLEKHTAPLVSEWADALLFANYEINIQNIDGKGEMKGKNKAVGIARRKLYSTKSPGFDAKNRWGLKDDLPFEFASISEHIDPNLINTITNEEVVTEVVSEVETVDVTNEKLDILEKPTGEMKIYENAKPKEDLSKVPKALQDLMMANKVELWEIINVLVKKGIIATGTPFENIPPETVQGLMISGWDKLYEFVLEDRDVDF